MADLLANLDCINALAEGSLGSYGALGRTMKGEGASGESHAKEESFVSPWVFLFPVTYLVHIAEEYWGGFPAWTAKRTGLAGSDIAFVAANAFLWLLMVGAIVAILSRRLPALMIVSLATATSVNAILHVGGTLLTRSYSPGLASGALLWLPLGILALARGRRTLSARDFRLGVILGVVVHILVPFIWLGFVFAFGGGWRAT